MQGYPGMNMNRPGLGLRPPMPSYGQGPSMMTLAQRQQPPPPMRPAQEGITIFVGSISGGITDPFLNQLLGSCGYLVSFKRLITPANKPQGFGFATYESPEGAARAVKLLDGVELPAMEDGCTPKKLLVRADELNRGKIDTYFASRMNTDTDDSQMTKAKTEIDALLKNIKMQHDEAANSGSLDKERYVVPPHLHDLQEADLPETQRGLVMDEIAHFRERAAKKEREKMKDLQVPMPNVTPAGPKQREWGKPQTSSQSPPRQGYGKGAQGYSKPVGFVKEGGSEGGNLASRIQKSDEEIEEERKDARRKDEESSFRDRERRYEPRERTRVSALERSIARQRAVKEAEERDRIEMKSRLHIWDDDESDELFYTDRTRWRSQRARRLATEEAADEESRIYEEKEADNLRRESEAFLARQMDEMQALADEQRKAGMLLDDGAPVKLNVSLQTAAAQKAEPSTETKAAVFTHDEEDEGFKKRKAPLVKLDFSVAEGEKAKERLEKIRENVAKDKDVLFKAKVRWDGVSDQLIDRKLEPLIKHDDLVMFSVEHIKDHKAPQKLVEGLEPVLEEEASELVVSLWRQVIFESLAYGEGLHTDRMMVD
ncbi:hypothetical protein DFH11DRAFT_1646152 [Phellopilus nigrolimitatus]|nr:hypothetical protein DFH11DRAFT_1646152 [Phellopilus nigrolimitatus]